MATYIVDELTDNRDRYQIIADSDAYCEETRQEAQHIASYMTLLLCRIGNGNVILREERQWQTYMAGS